MNGLYVMGITSLVSGDPKSRDSYHMFMWESDEKIEDTEVLAQFTQIALKEGHDFFILRSRPGEDRWHVISFDVELGSHWELVTREHMYLESDYPNLWDRMYDRYWTLRLGKKGKIPMPVYHSAVLAEIGNNTLKSGWHIDLYNRFCKVPIPASYRGHVIYPETGPLLVNYNTSHMR